jgi:hypothetical protein
MSRETPVCDQLTPGSLQPTAFPDPQFPRCARTLQRNSLEPRFAIASPRELFLISAMPDLLILRSRWIEVGLTAFPAVRSPCTRPRNAT